GYLVYGISNLPADVAVGKTITAQGVLDIYNGLYEITNATVTVGETAAVTPIDITEIFTAANGMSAAALVNMQSALVTIKGVTLKVSGSNLYVVIGNNEAQIFVGSGKSHVLDADALAAVKALVEANVGATADVTGYVTLYSNAFQLIPAADAIDIDTSVAAKLATPVVTINKTTGVASWAANNNAEGYIVKIDGVDGELTTETSVTLTNGQKIQVKAVGDGENYTDSDWSAEQTYTAKVPVTNGVEFDFSFISDSSASSTAYTATTATEAFKEACDNAGDFVSVTATEKVYPGDKDSSSGRSTGGLIKFSTSSVNGSVTLSFNKKAVRVVINCIAWQAASGSYDASKIKVNSATEQNVPQVATDLTFDITASNTVTISSTAKRFNIYSIIVYFENVEPTPLTAPEVTIDLDGLATWEPVTGATGYEYVITHSDSTTTTDTITATQVQLTDGDKIKVKSLGDGEDYISSDYGTEVTYTMVPVTLGVPVVEVNHAGVASWDAVENAVKYVYVINDGEEQETTHRTVQLTNGQSIKVKAVGKEGSRFQASAYCEPVTYTAPTVAEQLENPTVTVAIDGTVTIENENAVSFDYTIGDGEKQNVANGEDGAAVTLATKLTNGQTIKVVAKGDGTYYTDSAEVEITYTAPQALEAVTEVTIAIEGNTANKVVITWTAVANATGYSYQIGSAAAVTTTDTTLTVTLNEGTVFSITALGNTATAETAANGDYSAYYLDSTVYAAPAFNIDNEKTYTVSEIVKIAKYYGTTAPSKEFTVTGVVSSNAAYSTQYSNIDVVLKEGSDTFTVFRANFSAELLDTWKTAEANALVDCTVTATGKPFYYNSSTLEFNSGCKITAVEMSAEIRVAKAKAAMDDKLDCETTDEDYTYTLPLTGEFGTTITWSFEGLEEDDYIYDDEEGTLLVTRKDTEITFTATATISYTNGDDKANDTLSFELTVLATGSAVPETPKEVTETFTLNPLNGYTSGTAVTSLTSGDVTLTFAKGGNSSNEPKYYTANPSGVRCYPKNTITVTADGQTITKIELTYSGSNAITADNGTYNNNVWTGSATSVTFTIDGSSGNNAMTKIVVTYEAKPITEEDITVALNKISLEASYEATSFDVQTKIDRVEISWTSSNNEYVTINNETGKVTINCEDEQTVTLTATAECTCGEDTHHTKTFSVKVKKPSTSEPVTVTMKSTLSSGNMSKTENNAASVNLDASIFNVLSSGGSNNVGTYAELRMYKGNILTVSATGVTILSIKITISSSSYNPTHAVKAGDTVVTGTVSDLVEEYTINASSFSITNNASDNTQLRIKEIEITYQVG
ncbi:MAG: hypothetical protein J1G05_06195, partial [Clostridiales bacterium]|nr:hypothetical protein [Clostridiales bacterium]